jgi:hypothetical protein
MTNAFTWHKVSDSEKNSIKKEAKKIMDDFSKALEKIDKKGEIIEGVERDEFEREEGNGECVVIDRKIMFDNFRIKDSESDRESKKILKDSRHAPKKRIIDAQDSENLGATKSNAAPSRRKKKDFVGFIVAEKGGWE